jgi:hypothetical protein
MSQSEDNNVVWLSFIDLVDKHKHDHLPHQLGYLLILYSSRMMHDLIGGHDLIKTIADMAIFEGSRLSEKAKDEQGGA